MVAKVLPRGERWTYEYDANGNLVRQTDADGNATPATGDGVTTFSFDAANRQTKIDYADDVVYPSSSVPGVVETEVREPTPDVATTYDAAGNRIEMRDGAGSETYAYDDAGRLASIARGQLVLTYSYDRAGRIASRRYPHGTEVVAAYDADGRITRVSDGTHTTTQAYDPAGALSSRSFSNGVTETRTYDAASRLTAIESRNSAAVLDRFEYAYDPAGNPLSVSGSRPQETYAYDELDRLARVCFIDCDTERIEWDYDPVGNRLSETRPLGTTTYSYDASDRLVEERPATGAPVPYEYDANGNQTARGDERFAYDAADRHAAHIAGPIVHRYRYDGEGKRLSAETLPADLSAGVRTDYLWDPNNAYALLVEETENAGPVATDTRTSAYAGTELLILTNDPATADPTTRFVTHDSIGSVRTLTGAEGAPDASYGYEPFGVAKQTTEDPLSPANPARFTGEYLDGRSGLYHLRARDYDPRMGRFLAPDPVEVVQKMPAASRYVYADGRPLAGRDPTGQRPEWVNPLSSVRRFAVPCSGLAPSPTYPRIRCFEEFWVYRAGYLSNAGFVGQSVNSSARLRLEIKDHSFWPWGTGLTIRAKHGGVWQSESAVLAPTQTIVRDFPPVFGGKQWKFEVVGMPLFDTTGSALALFTVNVFTISVRWRFK